MAKNNNAASLGNIHGAINSVETPTEDALIASQIAVEEALRVTKRSGEKNVIYKLADTNVKGDFHLILVCDVKARPKKNEKGEEIPSYGNERMRALTGVESPWVADQKDIDKDYIKANKRYQVFHKGVAIVPEWDVQAITVLDRHNGNLDNPNPAMPARTKFFKWNPEKQAQELRKKQDERIAVILEASKVPDAEMRKHALYLGITFTDELGEPLIPEGLRYRYLAVAESDPKRWKESLNSKVVNVTYMVKKALQEGKIDTGRANHAIHWADGGFICKLPVSQTADKYLVEYAMTNSEEGKEFLENLKQRVV